MSSKTIEAMARAIHEARTKREPGWEGTWQDCVNEAEAAKKAVPASRQSLYDSSDDFSHIDPI
jgi:hypothetical protein